ncbi:MAG: diguanylate cyclase [Polyangiaceae bacterium]|nr:diguanylate cyclase [Polyangiaceae bacterium]
MKILIADDDKRTSRLLTRWVEKWGYEVVAASDGQEAWSILCADPEIRLCVLDWLMPEMTGLEICRKLRANQSEVYRYALLLTAKTRVEDVVQGIEAGADDYLVKPCNPLELEVRLRAGRRVVELQQSLIEAREQLRVEATHDALTGLLNRRAIETRLEREINRGARGHDLSVIMVDIDHFKSVNDNFGHQIGDRVLQEVARRMRDTLREYDFAGRYGGEEFLLVLSDCEETVAERVADRIRLSIDLNKIMTPRGELRVSCSLGVASTQSFPGATAEDLVRLADAALYQSKNAGRNRVTLAEQSLLGLFRAEPLPFVHLETSPHSGDGGRGERSLASDDALAASEAEDSLGHLLGPKSSVQAQSA